MVDPRRLRAIPDRVGVEIAALRRLGAMSDRELLADPERMPGAKYRLQVAIEGCIDGPSTSSPPKVSRELRRRLHRLGRGEAARSRSHRVDRGRRAIPKPPRAWLLLDPVEPEVCRFDPGFGDDLVVHVEDPLAFARWHLGQLGDVLGDVPSVPP